MKVNLKPKQYFFVLLGIAAVLVLAGGAGYWYGLKMINATSAQLSQNLGAQNAADEQLQYLARLQSQYEKDIVPILPLMDEALPRTKNQTEILAQLQTLAGESGLTLGSVSFPSPQGLPTATSQTVASGIVLALPINFQVTGSYVQLQDFLGKVEKLSRFTNVTTLSVTRPDRTKPIVYAMTVNAYVKP